jgi:hypothetical protein
LAILSGRNGNVVYVEQGIVHEDKNTILKKAELLKYFLQIEFAAVFGYVLYIIYLFKKPVVEHIGLQVFYHAVKRDYKIL